MKAIDLFAGPGGLSHGFREAGANVILAVDYDKEACKTHRENAPETEVLQKNLAESKPEEVIEQSKIKKDDVDVIIGGPPCRGFSIAGPREEDDERNSLVDIYLDWVEHVQPKAFLMENVPGIVNMYDGKFKEHIEDRVEDMGYQLNWEILNSAEYGVPQGRKRAIFVGMKNKDFEFPESTHHIGKQKSLEFQNLESAVTVGDAILDLPNLEAGEKSEIPNHEARNHGDIQVEKMSYIQPGDNWKELPEEYKPSGSYPSHAFHRLDPEKPSRVLPANASSTSILHPEDDRQITVREFARIQSFPDDYIFQGTIAGKYRQVGDAVPVELARTLGKSIKEQIG